MTTRVAPGRGQAARILAHLRRMIHAIHAQSAAIESAARLTGPQLWALREVVNQHDGITLGELAERLVLHRANAGRLVDRLAGKGLVRRETPEEDRRVVLVRPTSAGRRLAERAVANPVQADLLVRLEALPASQVDAIESAFAHVVGLLGAERVPAGPLFNGRVEGDEPRSRRPGRGARIKR